MIRWLTQNEKPVKKFSIERSYFNTPILNECYGDEAIISDGGKGIAVYYKGELVAAFSSYDSVVVLEAEKDDKQDTN